jgi:hypothetical protein
MAIFFIFKKTNAKNICNNGKEGSSDLGVSSDRGLADSENAGDRVHSHLLHIGLIS